MQTVEPVEKPGTDGMKALAWRVRDAAEAAVLQSLQAWGQAALRLQVFGAAGSRAVWTGQGSSPPTEGPAVSEVAAVCCMNIGRHGGRNIPLSLG